MSNIAILAWIAASGGFGGFVDGLMSSRSYTLRWNHKTKDIGSFGDILVGSAASLAIFTVATSIFTLEMDKLNEREMFVRLVAWGVLSGFVGIKLLQGLSKKLVEDIATKAAEDAVERAVTRDVEVEMNLKSGEAALTKYDMAKENGWLQTREADAIRFLDTALLKFDAVLEKQKTNEQALRGKAKAHRRFAELAKTNGNDSSEQNHWSEAMALLNKIVEKDRGASVAYYNLACYKQLSGANRKEVILNLRKAIEISPALKNNANLDPDLEAVKDSQEFKQLTL